MNINILRYSLFGIAVGQEVDHTFNKFIYFFQLLIYSQFIQTIYSQIRFKFDTKHYRTILLNFQETVIFVNQS